MAKEIKKIQNSQKIDLPFEVAQHYFKERQAEKRRAWLIFFVLLSITLIGLAASIAFPMLLPAIFLTSGGALLILPVLFLNVSVAVLGVYVTNIMPTLLKPGRIHFKADSIQVASNEKYQNFKHYTLSKGIENDRTVFSIDTQKKSIKDKIKLFYGIPGDTYLLLNMMMSKIEDERGNLEYQKDRLQTKITKLTDENKIRPLRKKIDLIEQKIKDCNKFLRLLDITRSPIYDKNHMVLYCKRAIENLHDTLLQNKKLLSKNQSPENRSELVENMNKAFLGIEGTKTYLKEDLLWRKSNEPIIEVIQEVDTLTRFILRSFIETNLKRVLIENPSYYAMYFKYLPEEMTSHFSHLLENKASQYKVLKILNDLLIDHPDPADPTNQTIHFILANHFYREFQHNKTKKISEQACLHALKLDSSDENNAANVANAGFKKTVIEAAFFFNEKHDTGLLSDEVQGLLHYSHENPHAYGAIKKCIQEQTSPPLAPIQFSESKPDSKVIAPEPKKMPATPPPTPTPKKL